MARLPPWSSSSVDWNSPSHFGQSSGSDPDSSTHQMAHGMGALSIAFLVVYIVCFVIATCIVINRAHDPETKTWRWDQPWVPAVTRRDACAMPLFPVFFLLPAIFWPLVVAGWILVLVGAGLRKTLGSATTCCGIPLPRGEQAGGRGGGGGSGPPGGEGAVGGGDGGDAPDGRGVGGGDEDDRDRAGVSSATSPAEAERPPTYDSVVPCEDGDGEKDGLLDKSAV